ncbi:glycosyltransferase [Lignipirellula cremea]|uniref:Alpha-D-kanosaminyltransferase n=1 Tax=Lignipirellula cremea TaxID=2528010 RepID=A0A518DTE1_9BACT|nr:glycosyltransferase [Lignipirellula cremea]QDU95093.1 Alpha-D-kanosaminyltransferase [Lignipirellula cremea]
MDASELQKQNPPAVDSGSETTNPAADARSLVRVLHLINGEHYSGAERVQDLLAMRLGEFGYDVGFACVKPDKFPKLRQSQQAPLHSLSMRNKFDFRAAWSLASLIRREGYQILHCHTPRSLMIGRLAAPLANVPLVYHVHSPTSRDSTRPIANWFNTATERLTLSGAARLITVSESLKRHMIAEGQNPAIIFAAPNGVPAQTALPPREPPTDTWTLGAVALFRPRKGMEVLIDALALLRDRGRRVRLRAVGPFETRPYERELRERVAERNVADLVAWTGFTKDVNAELTQMDLFVLPSLFGEGLPMVVLEAMAAGTPVVATEVEGVPEAIRDGIDGVLCEANDAEDLADAIERVISGELSWSELRKNGFERQSQKFSDVSMAARVAEIYDDLLTDAPPAEH